MKMQPTFRWFLTGATLTAVLLFSPRGFSEPGGGDLEPILQSIQKLNLEPETILEKVHRLESEEQRQKIQSELEELEGELERLNATKADLEKRLSEIQSLPASPDRGDLGEISSDNFEFFETHIRPVLAESCYACHGPEKQKAGLRLDNAESFLIGGESGPVFFPDDPEGSRLIKAIEYLDPSLQMPPSGKLPDAAIEDFKVWIRRGAPYPRTASTPTSSGSQSKGIDLAQAREWWSFQPVSNPTPPTVDDVGWASTP
ncbi:MAG: hypothetical protein KC940_20850, partial [Candidatus Omnitrophica bacterium]|nr:hypothetical protein [Candidatus Omnitrophota bacterium]